jgi:ubiquinone/menaquinone biosynthesis C-methylase UbiE
MLTVTPDQDKIVQFYQRSLALHGETSQDAAIVQWGGGTREQTCRFQVLFDAVDLGDKSLLDVGSGVGTLVKELQERRLSVQYTGIDIVKEFAQLSRKRFPDRKFVHDNVLNLDGQYDVVYCSGALTYKVRGNNKYYCGIIRKMYDLAREAVVFNMLEGTSPRQSVYARYDPKKIAKFCHSFCDEVEIIKGYDCDDFSICMRK